MPTDLSGPDVLVLVNEGVDVVVLELLDDGVGDIKVGLVVLTANWLHTRPVHTCQVLMERNVQRLRSKRTIERMCEQNKNHVHPLIHTYSTQKTKHILTTFLKKHAKHPKGKHTETDRINVHGLQQLDILVNKGPIGDKVVDVDVPGEGLLDHVGAMEPATATLGIDELLGSLVDTDNLGDVGLSQLEGG